MATKTMDGPAPAVLATQKLFLILRDARKITWQQVTALLRSEAGRAPALTNALAKPGTAHAAQHECEQAPAAAAPGGPVPEQVLAHLQAMAARIDAKGKASLLQCTTNLGRAYLPAIRFLM